MPSGTYQVKRFVKLLLLLNAVLIGLVTLWYTNRLVEKLAKQEREHIKIWANATKQILYGISEDPSFDFTFPLSIIKTNQNIPVIILDQDGKVSAFRNIDSLILKDSSLLAKEIEEMKSINDPIVLEIDANQSITILYKNSLILQKLKSYPIIQLFVISVFMLISYLAFSYSRKAEQNQVWVGLSKETAHQLGTPISSLMAWTDLLSEKNDDSKILSEMKNDLERLNTITERFSKIGSQPKLSKQDLVSLVEESVRYLANRVSKKIEFDLEPAHEPLLVMVNPPLIAWVIENLSKNAVDAMHGEGIIRITFGMSKTKKWIDFSDNGTGIPSSKHKTIFKPGYTSKNRGWGLGLSLSKRIMNNYHNGDIFVLKSQVGVGTTFRILIKT